MQWKVAPALAAGCTVVLKPSEMTSVTSLELAAIVDEVGLPPGVFNLVTGLGADAGAPLRSVILCIMQRHSQTLLLYPCSPCS